MPIDIGGNIVSNVTVREYEYVSIPTPGLLLHLDARIFDTISGTSWYDFSGNGYTHTLSGGATTATVGGVNCIDCTGTNRVVDSGTTFTFGNDHTMIAWAYTSTDAQVGNWRTLWRTLPDDHPLLIQDGTDIVGYYDNNSAGFVSYGVTAAGLGIANTWSMITVVGTGGTSTSLYINNNSVSGTVNYNATGLTHNAIGSTDGGSQPYGYVAAAYIYDRALTTTEISHIYDITKHKYGY